VAVAANLLPGAAEKAIGQGHAQHQGHAHRHGDSGQKADQSSRPGMMKGGMRHGMMGGMEGMKMSEPMKMRHQMMMNMEVTPQDPAALLALKDQLQLSDEQTSRLQAILTQARQQAGQVLTEQQTAQLRPLEKLPKTMMQMMEHMDHEQPATKRGATDHGHKH
jgi:hypothetical protein